MACLKDGLALELPLPDWGGSGMLWVSVGAVLQTERRAVGGMPLVSGMVFQVWFVIWSVLCAVGAGIYNA